MGTYIYRIVPARAEFLSTLTPDEQAVMGEHLSYLRTLHVEGCLKLAGPCLDAAFGIVIFEAADETAAEALMLADPAVREGLMFGDVHPFRVAVGQV